VTHSTNPNTQFNIGSATSEDLLRWAVESGNRVGTGAAITTSPQQPHALRRAGDCVTLCYNCRVGANTGVSGVCYATAADGVTFSREYALDLGGGTRGAGADVVRLPDGSYRLYHDHVDGTVTPRVYSIRVGRLELNGCTYALSPASQEFGPEGGTGVVDVAAASTCTWTAATAAPWITITASSSGAGSGTVTYLVGSNLGTDSRRATLMIAEQTFTVTQAAP